MHKFNTRGKRASRLNQSQRLLGDPQRNRQARDDLAIGLYREGFGGGHERGAAAQEGDVFAPRDPAEQQRGEGAQYGKPAGALQQHEIEHRLGKAGARGDHMGAGVEPAFRGNHRGGAVLDAVGPDGKLARPVTP